MKKEIRFIDVEENYGGSQKWMPKKKMILGGCSAICAGEICCVLKKYFKKRYICTIDTDMMTKEFFISFCCVIYKYVRPGRRGVDSTKMFVSQFKKYLEAAKAEADITEFSGERTYEEAKAFIKEAIDAGYPIAYLLLSHENIIFDDIEWHWFTVTGYEEKENGGFDITFATWGEKRTADFKLLWDTGKKEKGGMVLIK